MMLCMAIADLGVGQVDDDVAGLDMRVGQELVDVVDR